MGVARQFGALGGTGVHATGASALIIGDVGSSTGGVRDITLANVGPPFVIHMANDGIVRRARRDANRAYANLLARDPGTVLADNLALAGPLMPGTYSFATGAPYLPAFATLTLNRNRLVNGGGVFIFNVDQSLTADAWSNVSGTADPCNIYWRVGSSATLGGETFRGTVLAGGDIALGKLSRLAGRALAGPDGAVTTGGDSAIVDCSVVTVVPWSPPWWLILFLVIVIGYATYVSAKAKIKSLPEW